MKNFTPETLVDAISSLFKQNNFKVEGPLKVHGAEVDLLVRSNSDPFAPSIYIEATVEYVNTEKYGKDSSKFILLREVDPNSTLLCISSSGFSLPVLERAKMSRVETLTYAELFSRFERFGEYIDKVVSVGEMATEIAKLDSIYEEARFKDIIGDQSATEFLTDWKNDPNHINPWIIVVGDYGTGKTALTRVILRRWMLEYKDNPSLPIPFRIELRDFTRQFDARGLLHHFLDSNGLSHISVDFVFSLIRQGRVVLLLDGYDEMAQYMHARERRVCLSALAELSKGGAKGILTSRPNYFTEAEELNLLDSLYASLADESRVNYLDKNIIDAESALDKILKNQFLERYERFLRDLDNEQTKSLVRRSLEGDESGQNAILNILENTFRANDDGAAVSLSGKPVIISYLLEVVEEIKNERDNEVKIAGKSGITEWQVYNLIVDKLMYRDYRRAPEVLPSQRRDFLKQLSVQLSRSQNSSIGESGFLELIRKVFSSQLRKIPSELREQEVQKLFADLRSSATLTRRSGNENVGWRFSHNSLREYLAADYLVEGLRNKDSKIQRMKISDAMQIFVLSLPKLDRESLVLAAASLNANGISGEVMGLYTSLIWHSGLRLMQGAIDPVSELVSQIFGMPASCSEINLNRINFSQQDFQTNLERANFSGSSLTDVNFNCCNLEGADFSGAILEGVSFKNSDLRDTNFQGAILIEADFTDTELESADFRNLADYSGIRSAAGIFNGEVALGYFAFEGARTDSVTPIYICRHHPNYSIAEKIARKFCEQPTRQKRGLTQRGPAAKDPATARMFLQELNSHGLVEDMGGREELVKLTDKGRPILTAFVEGTKLDPSLFQFFELA